jgi:hypothetical protein
MGAQYVECRDSDPNDPRLSFIFKPSVKVIFGDIASFNMRLKTGIAGRQLALFLGFCCACGTSETLGKVTLGHSSFLPQFDEEEMLNSEHFRVLLEIGLPQSKDKPVDFRLGHYAALSPSGQSRRVLKSSSRAGIILLG